MEDDFRNLTAKVWANLDIPINKYDFSKVSLISAYIFNKCEIYLNLEPPNYTIKIIYPTMISKKVSLPLIVEVPWVRKKSS